MKDIIEKTSQFLKDTLNKSENIDEVEKKYRYEHSLRVANIGAKLADLEKADKLIVVLGCLLHDVGKFETENNIDHGRVSAKVARPFLETLDLTEKQVDDICYAIAYHVDGKAGYDYEHTLEADIVTDSDNIDRFGAYRIYQILQWKNVEQNELTENIKIFNDVITKFDKWEQEPILQTKSGNEMFLENTNFQKQFYKRYVKELEKTKVPTI